MAQPSNPFALANPITTVTTVTRPLNRHTNAALLRVRSALISLKEMLITGGPVLLLAVGLVWMAYVMLDPNPPRRMVLATGTAQGRMPSSGSVTGRRSKSTASRSC